MKSNLLRFSFFLFMILLLSQLPKCSSDKPEHAVRKELDLIKELDESTIKAFISYEDMMSSKSSGSDIGSETTKAVQLFFKNFDYKITKTTATENSATVHAEIKNLDTHALARDVCLTIVQQNTAAESSGSMTLNSYFQILGSVLESHDYKLVTHHAEIELLHSEDGWVIQNTSQLEDDLVSGFITYLKDPYLVTPEEIITVVLEGLIGKTAEEWRAYLNMNDIFSTYSQNYEKTDLALAEQLHKHISYRILSVKEDKENKSALAKLCITSLDMEQVLKKYQEFLIDYAETTESVRATPSELADETALLLEKALKENNATIDTNVDVKFLNNGSTWEMQLNEDFTNALLGNAGTAIEAFLNES